MQRRRGHVKLLYQYFFGKPKLSEFQDELANSPLFAALTFREIQRVLEYATLRTFAKNENVFFEGDLSSAMYLILRGNVEIVSHNPKRISLAQLSKGTFFGEIGVVHNFLNSKS